MLTVENQAVERAEVVTLDPALAVEEIASQLGRRDKAGVLFFCSSNYDSDELAARLEGRFDCPVIGCTSAGEIGSRYQENGIVALGFDAEHFRLHPRLIAPLAEFDHAAAKRMADSVRSDLEFSDEFRSEAMFGITLLDGLSVLEESVIAMIHSSIEAFR